jgi:hypothetical protein
MLPYNDELVFVNDNVSPLWNPPEIDTVPEACVVLLASLTDMAESIVVAADPDR